MGRRRKKGLRDRHKRILEVLERFTDKYGYPPSIREICAEADISSTSVANYYLEQLEEMGYIDRDRRVSRGLRLIKPLSEIMGTTKEGAKEAARAVKQAAEEFLRIPIAGRIVASEPLLLPGSDFNYYDAESAVDVARSLLPTREAKPTDLFALEVKGDSMIDAMVNDGDIVIMKQVQEAHNGEMVAIWLGDKEETTLKFFYRENGSVRLQPANPTMEPIYIEDPSSLKIQGKVVMVIRQIGGGRA
jgi:repressor LexA